MEHLEDEESKHYPRNCFHPLSKTRVKPFDVEAVLAETTEARKKRAKKYHGPDSLLYAAIYPSVCITKIFGLAPYDFTADNMTPSNIGLLLSFVFMGLYCYILYRVYTKLLSLETTLLSTVETTKVTVNFIVVMFDLIWTMSTRKAFCRVWNALQDYDERLNRLGYPRKEGKTETATWTLLIGQVIVWTVINQSGMYAFAETWLFNVSYMIVYVGAAVSVYKFFGMVGILGQRFHRLNRIARENLPPRVGFKSSNLSRQTIQDLHDELMRCGESLSSLYSWPLLFWLGNLIVHSVSNLYFIIDWSILQPWTEKAGRIIINMCCWMVTFIAQLLAIHLACDYTVTEANTMAVILIEWDARIVHRYSCDDTIRTSLLFLNRRLRFPVGGLHNVHLKLFCSIVGTLSTYLMLLLQFPA